MTTKKNIQASKIEIPREYYLNNPSKIIKDDILFYATKNYELSEKGLLVHKIGTEHPQKGGVTPKALYATNILKQIVKSPLGLNAIFLKIFEPFIVEKKYLCPTARQMYLILLTITKLETFSYIFAHIFEYDDAYRYYIQDIASIINITAFRNNPRKEIKRVLKVFQERASAVRGKRIDIKPAKIINRLLLLLYIPFIKQRIITASVYIKEMEFDNDDWYWVCLRDDYNFGGLSFQERIQGKKYPQVFQIRDVDKYLDSL